MIKLLLNFLSNTLLNYYGYSYKNIFYKKKKLKKYLGFCVVLLCYTGFNISFTAFPPLLFLSPNQTNGDEPDTRRRNGRCRPSQRSRRRRGARVGRLEHRRRRRRRRWFGLGFVALFVLRPQVRLQRGAVRAL